jgi:hypothetical protein
MSLAWSPFWMEEMAGGGPGRGERPEALPLLLPLAAAAGAAPEGGGWGGGPLPARPSTAAAAAAVVRGGWAPDAGAGAAGAAAAAAAAAAALCGPLAAIADQLRPAGPEGGAGWPWPLRRGLLPAGSGMGTRRGLLPLGPSCERALCPGLFECTRPPPALAPPFCAAAPPLLASCQPAC